MNAPREGIVSTLDALKALRGSRRLPASGALTNPTGCESSAVLDAEGPLENRESETKSTKSEEAPNQKSVSLRAASNQDGIGEHAISHDAKEFDANGNKMPADSDAGEGYPMISLQEIEREAEGQANAQAEHGARSLADGAQSSLSVEQNRVAASRLSFEETPLVIASDLPEGAPTMPESGLAHHSSTGSEAVSSAGVDDVGSFEGRHHKKSTGILILKPQVRISSDDWSTGKAAAEEIPYLPRERWLERLHSEFKYTVAIGQRWLGVSRRRRIAVEAAGLLVVGVVSVLAARVLLRSSAQVTPIEAGRIGISIDQGLPSSTDTDTPNQAQGATAAPRVSSTIDWADSVDVPPEILRGAPSEILAQRGQSPRGTATPPRRETRWNAPATAGPSGTSNKVNTPSAELTTLRPMVVRRVSGSRVGLYPLTQMQRGDIAGEWSVPPACDDVIRVNQAETRSPITGEEVGRQGNWTFALAVSRSRCREADGQVAGQTRPSPSDLAALARDLSPLAEVAGLPQGTVFGAKDIRDVMVGSVGGVRHAWGVFRGQVNTTQILPPPPLPQMAFVAILKDGQWRTVWTQSAISSADLLAFAGLYARPDGSPAALFAWRRASGTTLLQLMPSSPTAWRVTDRGAL